MAAALASWQGALSVCSTSAGLVASSIGRTGTGTDVSAVDVDARTAIVL
ncbi:hypothetical protein WDV85_14485 [Pseudokineococcus sp. 5B2Z-1]